MCFVVKNREKNQIKSSITKLVNLEVAGRDYE